MRSMTYLLTAAAFLLCVFSVPVAADTHFWDPPDPGNLDWSDPVNWKVTPGGPETATIGGGDADISSGTHEYSGIECYGWSPGRIDHSGGSLTAGHFLVSTDSGPYAYHLGGTGVYSADMMTLGCWGAEAHVEQTGGTMNVELFRTSGPGTISFSGGSSSISDLRLSELRHADMSMNISGDAGVTTGSMVIGSYGTANVTQTGGNLQVGSIAIGQNAGSEGSLTVTGGTWSGSNDLTVGAGGKGDFIWDNGRTTLQRLHIGAAGGIQAGPGSVFEMTNGSSIVIHTVDASRVSLEEATFEMKPSSPGFGSHSMEVASRDMGPTEQGFEQNFALGKLDLQTTGEFCLKLYDQADNNPSDDGPDALYVDELLLGNSTIDTNGLPVYYRNGGEVKRLLSGDNNLDGEVNLLDFSMMCSNYETGPAGWNGGDCDGDGDVDDDDLSIFAESYTAHWDPQMVHAPEPGALLVMVTAGALLLKRRRR